MSAHEFVRRLKNHADESDRHYTFWLGAGCSVSSGIPAAAALVRDHWLPRLQRLQGPQGIPVEEWAREKFTEYDHANPAALYGSVMNALFRLKEDRQRETERLCEKGVPGFGYAVLAALMSRPDGAFSAALTTNFDDLVADSMYVYGHKRPLVIQHDALSGFVRPGRVRRPLVVKVHGDHRLNPMHTSVETAELEKGMRKGVHGLLHDRGVIFIGYAGNDLGVLKALKELPGGATPLGVWWVSRQEPTSAVRPWLESREATWVQVDGFDELMLLFREEFDIEHPTAQKFERMVERYRETYQQLGVRIEGLPSTAPDSEALKAAARNARNAAEDWWKVELEARQFADSDPEKAERIYQQGVDRLEDARLYCNFAIFLYRNRSDGEQAERYFQKALEIEPGRASIFGNYANFLADFCDDSDGAEANYKRALELDPENHLTLGNYGVFLADIREDPERAETYLKRALEIEPDHANNLNNYATLLCDVHNDFVRAEKYFQRALELDPDGKDILGNYGRLLLEQGKDEEGWKMVEAAREGTEDSALQLELGFYAFALADRRRAQAALPDLIRRVEAGVRSPGWDFSRIVDRARAEGRQDIDWVQLLSDVIAGRADASELDEWPAWQSN